MTDAAGKRTPLATELEREDEGGRAHTSREEREDEGDR
jgi:hypothetical protein